MKKKSIFADDNKFTILMQLHMTYSLCVIDHKGLGYIVYV
jgi:hypothetical protein